MIRSFMVGVFGCLEYAATFLFIASLAMVLAQGVDVFTPDVYDSPAEAEWIKAVKEGFETGQITSQQAGEILQFLREEQAKRQRRRAYIIYAALLCVSAGVTVPLFKKYRSLRFRERFGDYFFPAKT